MMGLPRCAAYGVSLMRLASPLTPAQALQGSRQEGIDLRCLKTRQTAMQLCHTVQPRALQAVA